MNGYSREKTQAMVDRAYALGLNETPDQPWQDHIPSVEMLERDLKAASTWPDTQAADQAYFEAIREARAAWEAAIVDADHQYKIALQAAVDLYWQTLGIGSGDDQLMTP